MKKILLLLLVMVSLASAQTASVQVDANGTVLNFQSPSTKAVNFPTGKLTVNGVQITGLEADASTTVKGVTKLSVAPVSSSNPIAVGDNDSRNTNARTPTAHASTHANAGSDPVTLIISQITGLQGALDLKASLASPIFTGVPLAPTASVDTNTTQIATTGFVLAQAANTTPIVASTGAVGTSTRYARQDHVHPAQTSVTGNAGTATALQTARTINGTSFDGTANITVTAAAGTLTGTTLASGVTASSLLSASGGSFGTAAFTASSAYATSSQGVTTLSLATPNVLYTTPVTFSNASGAWTGTLSLNTQSANTFFAGPTTGSAATPTMRALVVADLPSLTKAQLNTIVSDDDPAYLGTANAFTAAQSLTLSNAQAQTNTITGLGTTTLPGLQVTNTTAAAAGAQQYSPSIRWSGKGWKTDATAASQAVDFRTYVVPVQGTASPTGLLQFESSINGAAFTNPITFGSDATIRQYSGTTNYTGFSTDGFILSFIQNGSMKASLNNSGDFGSTTFYINGDTYLRRNAAGVFEITGGTAGQWGGLKLGTRDSGTNTITNGLTLGHQSTGTPAAGLGEAILGNLDSSTTADQSAFRLYYKWSDATHATRTSALGIQLVNSAAALADVLTISGAGLVTVPGALTVTGHTTFEGVTSTGATGAGKLVYDTSPQFATAAGFGVAAPSAVFANYFPVVLSGSSGATLDLASGATTQGRLVADSNGLYVIGNGYVVLASGSNSGTGTERLRVDTARVTFGLPAKLKGYTAATLPGGTEGDVAYITDALTPAFGTVVTGGGSTRCIVFYNGTAWVAQ